MNRKLCCDLQVAELFEEISLHSTNKKGHILIVFQKHSLHRKEKTLFHYCPFLPLSVSLLPRVPEALAGLKC